MGCIAIIWQEEVGWQVEGTTNYGPNVVCLVIMVVWKIWYVVGEYVTSNDQLMVHWADQVLAQILGVMETLLVSDFNDRLAQPHNW